MHPWRKKRKVCPHDPFINAMPSSRDPCIRGEQEKIATDTRIKKMHQADIRVSVAKKKKSLPP